MASWKDRVPPLGMEQRWAWSKEHPWFAGVYFGMAFAVAMTLVTWHAQGFRVGILLGSGIWIASGASFGYLLKVGNKRGWGERPHAESFPMPTPRRWWSRNSDRSLLLFMLLGIIGFISSLFNIAIWVFDFDVKLRQSLVVVWFSLVASAVFAGTTWTERRRRRNAS